MGKGTRKRSSRDEKRQKQLLEQERIKKEKKARWRVRILVSACTAVVVCIGILLGNLALDGFFMRNTISASATTIKVDNAMISYFFNKQYTNYTTSYSSYLSMMGLDTEKSLKTQNYSEEQTWFEYFMDATKSTVKEMILMAEAANSANITLDDSDNAKIEKYLVTLQDTAKTKAVSYQEYLRSQFGKGIKEEDVRKCLELTAIYTKYKNVLYEEFDYTEKQIDAYYKEKTNTFRYFDYKSYAFNSTIPEGATEEETAKINAATKVKADELAASKTTAEFDAALTKYLKSIDTAEATITETVTNSLTEASTYNESSEVSKWAFADGRAVGDTTVIAGTNQYSVYYLTATPYRKEYTTKNIRHILVSSSVYKTDEAAFAKANELKDTWLKGEKTPESFGLLANEYSEDSGSNTNGGLYTNIAKDEMTDVFDAWAYDSARVAGEADVIKTTYGYHVIYFESDGLVAWRAEVYDALQKIDYDAKYAEYETLYPITFSDSKLNSISA